MTEIDLRSFEKRIHIRSLELTDFDDVVALQLRCFPGMEPWTREEFESQLSIFQEGQMCVTLDARLVASCSSLILSYDEDLSWHNFRSAADDGMIRNHDPSGDTLYGIATNTRGAALP